MAVTVTKKSSMTGDVFAGISALYAVKDGFTTADGTGGAKTCALSNQAFVELPVSESGGVSINGGTASTDVFKVHGLTAPWTSRMTPGDVEISLQVPTYNNTVLELIYGSTATTLNVTGLVSGVVGTATSLTGKAFGWPDKSVILGLLIVNDTGDKALFIKKAKFTASPSFDGEDTPFAVTLTGTVEGGAEVDSLAILTPGS